ncbi:MAG TPA: hypothetical protein VFE27_24220 [Acidobacteriaceae bacterium]|jgi:hypothetical protein|nr:hypothetical protein [Acidobacteriaceae bacterium]
MLKNLWKKLKLFFVGADPESKPQCDYQLPPGVLMGPGQEDQLFVIRLADLSYYAGPSPVSGQIERTPRPQDAALFNTRWAALQAATAGVVFAHAAIVPIAGIIRPGNAAAKAN